jgi:hypothetical protein
LSTQSRTRELARLRQIRKRARDTERRSIRVEAEARRIEADATRAEYIGETLAPAVMREPVRAPDGHMLLGARVAIVNGRPVRSLPDQIARDPLFAHVRLTARQAKAAAIFRMDWEEVGAGIGGGAVDYLRSGGSGGDGQGAHHALVVQLATRARLDAAFAAAGAFSPILARVVLDCIPVSVWARETGQPIEDAMAWLRGGLDRLANYYAPPVPERKTTQKYPTFGPARESYEVAEPSH